MWSLFSRDPVKDFPYDIGEPIEFVSTRSFWKLHKGKKKGSGQDVTIFILDNKSASPAEIDAAKTAIKRLKTLRHPSILTFYDSVESEKAIYLATEYVLPLELYLQNKENLRGDLSLSWGLFQITRALSFLINDGNLKHNSIQIGCCYVNNAGEWKLGGAEFVSSEVISLNKVPAILNQLEPPESSKNGINSKIQPTKWSSDSWGLGVLIWEVFNGLANNATFSNNKNMEKIPKSLSSICTELFSESAVKRPNPADVIARGRRPGGFFKNDLVDTLLFLEEIQIKEASDKTKFFNGLPNALDKFPTDLCRYKILPELLNAFEFGNAGSAVLAPLFKLGKLLDDEEYQAKIVPCVVKLFSSADRATRVRLLQQLEHFVDHLSPATVNDKIFANLVSGFMDTNPTVREQTVKAMLYLAPKLNNNNLNTELLKHFARLQIKDDQGGIRTNTTICLGKIAVYLNSQTRRKVLIPAFTRVFQDVFPQAKVAGILALAATQQYHLLTDVSTKILPALCTLTSDPDKSVRDNAFKTIKGFLGKLEKVSDNPTLKEKFEADVDSNVAGVASSASGWAGWAVSALSSKFNRSQSQQSTHGQIGQVNQVVGTRTKGRYPFDVQSSSSTSTTTSSIPSTPSGERDVLQPTIEGQESATDYDEEDWGNEDWGSIDGDENNLVESVKTNPESTTVKKKETSFGRSPDTEKLNKKQNDGWDTWAIDEQDENTSSWNNDSTNDTTPSFEFEESGSHTEVSSDHWENNWSGDHSSELPVTSHRNEEMRKRREERKLLRQQELEAKKSSRAAGPMKLGSKLMQ